MSPDLTTSDEVCNSHRDPDAIMRQAHDEQDRFWRGGYVDAAGRRTYLKAHGRRFVNHLTRLGYPGTVVLRVAIQTEGQP